LYQKKHVVCGIFFPVASRGTLYEARRAWQKCDRNEIAFGSRVQRNLNEL
jgi:hypothetical protein